MQTGRWEGLRGGQEGVACGCLPDGSLGPGDVGTSRDIFGCHDTGVGLWVLLASHGGGEQPTARQTDAHDEELPGPAALSVWRLRSPGLRGGRGPVWPVWSGRGGRGGRTGRCWGRSPAPGGRQTPELRKDERELPDISAASRPCRAPRCSVGVGAEPVGW